jgi:hypothetical protein
MPRARFNFLPIVVLGLVNAAIVLPACGVTVPVKPGLWERTVVSRVFETRTLVPELGRTLSDEQKKIDAAMRKPVHAPDVSNTSRECLPAHSSTTWEALTKLDREYTACTRTPIAQSSRTFKASLLCNAGKTTGKAEFKATQDYVEGEITVVSHESAYDRTDTKLIKSKWISATCDDASRK